MLRIIFRTSVRAFDGLLTLTGYITGLITIFMMLIVTYDVVMRYFFSRPTLWVIDVSTLGIPFITLLAAAWALRDESHIKIDLIPQRMPPRRRAFLHGVNSIIALLACLIFLWQGIAVTIEAYQWDEQLFRNLIIPKYLLLWIFPFGALLLSIQLIRRARRYFATYRQLKREAETGIG